MSHSYIEQAVEIATGQTALKDAINQHIAPGVKPVKQQNIWGWMRRGIAVPGEYCRPIEAATRGVVTRYQLRPDIFGSKPESTSDAA